jgi:hypothetical protein
MKESQNLSNEQARLDANEDLVAAKAFVLISLNQAGKIETIWCTSELNTLEANGFLALAKDEMKDINVNPVIDDPLEDI